jgi:hypothetical protein
VREREKVREREERRERLLFGDFQIMNGLFN